jgi:ATP-binding protein involved in chromosome partitioning
MTDPAPSDALRIALDAALRTVTDPATGRDLRAAGLVDALDLKGSAVRLTLRAAPDRRAALETLAQAAQAALRQVPGITEASVILTHHRDTPPAPPPPGRPRLLAHIRQIIAVASGKGGVGKSTTAVNLAIALARTGLAVGLLDADIHGPSLPTMLGTAARPQVRGDRIQPIEAWGLRCMSIGFMVDTETAMIWRGPMVMGALEQMLGQVDWGDLDLLVIDMPPGTGDAQLTLSQRLRLAGAVIVSTPQDVALLDARRGVRMFEKTSVPVLGLVENMSYFRCPACGAQADIFGHGGARREAHKLGVPFLGEIPLLLEVRESSDAGTPIVAAAPTSPAAQAYVALAAAVQTALAERRVTEG